MKNPNPIIITPHGDLSYFRANIRDLKPGELFLDFGKLIVNPAHDTPMLTVEGGDGREYEIAAPRAVESAFYRGSFSPEFWNLNSIPNTRIGDVRRVEEDHSDPDFRAGDLLMYLGDQVRIDGVFPDWSWRGWVRLGGLGGDALNVAFTGENNLADCTNVHCALTTLDDIKNGIVGTITRENIQNDETSPFVMPVFNGVYRIDLPHGEFIDGDLYSDRPLGKLHNGDLLVYASLKEIDVEEGVLVKEPPTWYLYSSARADMSFYEQKEDDPITNPRQTPIIYPGVFSTERMLDALAANKADLEGGTIPLGQLPASVAGGNFLLGAWDITPGLLPTLAEFPTMRRGASWRILGSADLYLKKPGSPEPILTKFNEGDLLMLNSDLDQGLAEEDFEWVKFDNTDAIAIIKIEQDGTEHTEVDRSFTLSQVDFSTAVWDVVFDGVVPIVRLNLINPTQYRDFTDKTHHLTRVAGDAGYIEPTSVIDKDHSLTLDKPLVVDLTTVYTAQTDPIHLTDLPMRPPLSEKAEDAPFVQLPDHSGVIATISDLEERIGNSTNGTPFNIPTRGEDGITLEDSPLDVDANGVVLGNTSTKPHLTFINDHTRVALVAEPTAIDEEDPQPSVLHIITLPNRSGETRLMDDVIDGGSWFPPDDERTILNRTS